MIKHFNETHGMSSSVEYNSWCGMKRRCYNKKDKKFERYGSRGIKVSKKWKNSFSHFYKDMGPRPSSKHSLDRIDNNKGYSKDNCRWATQIEQQNNKQKNIRVTFMGMTKTLKEWSYHTGISYMAIYLRFTRLKWNIEKTLTTKQQPRSS